MTRAVSRLLLGFGASLCVSGLVVAQGGGRYSTALSGDNEVPSVSTGASGTLNLDIDENGEEISYELTFSGLQGEVRQSHIHFAQPGVNGGIVLWLCDSATNNSPVANTPLCPQSGTVTGTLVPADVQGTAANTQQINAGEFAEAVEFIKKGLGYANVHTTLSPGGEIRGQIRQGGGHK